MLESTADNHPYSRHYLNQFSTGRQALESMESAVDEPAALTESDIRQKQERVRAELFRVIETHLGNDSALKDLAEKIVRESKDPLLAVADRNDRYLNQHPEKTSLLEVIVRTDGSRPSFMVRNGDVDLSTSPAGNWSDILLPQAEQIRNALDCVGRIDLWDRHVGTGFLIHENLILTNRHVLQGIAHDTGGGNWVMKDGAQIDFGREFRARESLRPRKLRKVVFCGRDPIVPTRIDHRKLDLALIELAAATDDQYPAHVLKVDLSTEWSLPGRSGYLYTIGYPGNPGMQGTGTYGSSLLELLFRSTYGYKRLAPGETLLSAEAAGIPWTSAHDATTLGGNSGSVVLVAGREYAAAGLHYGGRLMAPRENWAHILGKAVHAADATGTSLRERLDVYGVGTADII